MSQRDLAGPHPGATTDQCDCRGAVVGCTKGPDLPATAVKAKVRYRVDGSSLKGLTRLHIRQDAGKPLRQHRLAAAWRAHHHQRMPAGRRNFKRPPAKRLPADILEIRLRIVLTGPCRRHVTGQHRIRCIAGQVRPRLCQAGDRQ